MVFLREQLQGILLTTSSHSSQYLMAKEILKRLNFNLPLNSSEIAKKAFTSKPSVIRFAQSFGFLGFKDFREELLLQDQEYIFKANEKTYEQSFKDYNLKLNHLIDEILKEKTKFFKIASLIKEKKKIFIFTSPENVYIGIRFANKLGILGYDAFTIGTNQSFLQNRVKENDLVLFLISGLDILTTLKIWNKVNSIAKTILIASPRKLLKFKNSNLAIKIDVGPDLLRIQFQKFLYSFILDQIFNLLVYSNHEFLENIDQFVFM